MLPARAMDTIEAAHKRPRSSHPRARKRSVITSKDKDMGAGSIGETAGDEFTTPRVRRMRRSVLLLILVHELKNQRGRRESVNFVTG
jgi:hypothetical protein